MCVCVCVTMHLMCVCAWVRDACDVWVYTRPKPRLSLIRGLSWMNHKLFRVLELRFLFIVCERLQNL